MSETKSLLAGASLARGGPPGQDAAFWARIQRKCDRAVEAAEEAVRGAREGDHASLHRAELAIQRVHRTARRGERALARIERAALARSSPPVQAPPIHVRARGRARTSRRTRVVARVVRRSGAPPGESEGEPPGARRKRARVPSLRLPASVRRPVSSPRSSLPGQRFGSLGPRRGYASARRRAGLSPSFPSLTPGGQGTPPSGARVTIAGAP